MQSKPQIGPLYQHILINETRGRARDRDTLPPWLGGSCGWMGNSFRLSYG